MAGGKKSARPSKREEEEETEEEPLDPLASYVPASFGWEKEAESSSVSDEYSLLSSSVISYEGGRDESGRYSGSGVAVFKGGEKYNGEFQVCTQKCWGCLYCLQATLKLCRMGTCTVKVNSSGKMAQNTREMSKEMPSLEWVL